MGVQPTKGTALLFFPSFAGALLWQKFRSPLRRFLQSTFEDAAYTECLAVTAEGVAAVGCMGDISL